MAFSHAEAGLLEVMSQASQTVTSAEFCSSYNEKSVRRKLETQGQFCADCEFQSPHEPQAIERYLDQMVAKQSAEDLYFAKLAEQHALELDCSASFAQQIREGKLTDADQKNLRDRFATARAAKQRIIQATQQLQRPDSLRKVCPLSLEELKSQPLPRDLNSKDDEICGQLIRARLAYQSIAQSMPLISAPAVRSFFEKYTNLPEGPELETLQRSLDESIRQTYGEAEKEVSAEARQLRNILKTKGGAGFSREERYSLLQDPRVVHEVLRQQGGGKELEAVACSASARYGKGADALDNVLTFGSLALSGGAAVTARVGSVAAKVAQGMQQARSAGLLSLSATRALQISAFAADGLSSYSQLEKDCKLSMRAKGTEGGQCVSAPEVERIGQDGCLLESSLTVIGFGLVAAEPAVSLARRTLKPKLSEVAARAEEALQEGAAKGRTAKADEIAKTQERQQTELAPVSPPATDLTRTERVTRVRAKTARTNARKAYTDKYLNLEITTPEQNRAWIARAEAPYDPKKPTLFLEVEHSKLQYMNTQTKDKNFVTATTNRHKMLLFQRIDELEKKYPGLVIERYSDFKSSRFALTGRIPKDIDNELAKIFKEVNNDFTDELLARGKHSGELAVGRAEDKPDLWFRAGCGSRPGWAYAATRFARRQQSGNVMTACDAPDVRQALDETYRAAEAKRAHLETVFKDSWLMKGPAGEKELSLEVVKLLRKSDTPEEIRQKIMRERGIKISAEDSQILFEYGKHTDEFSPNLYIPERRIVNLDGAEKGGISADFINAGAWNSIETNSALRRAKNVDEAIEFARQGERRVTEVFDRRRNALLNITGGQCSGEDCAESFKKVMSYEDKKKMMDRIASNPDTRDVRVAAIPDKVPAQYRNALSTHGESIARYVTRELEKILPQNRFDKMTVGIDMQTRELNEGKVRAIVGIDPRTPLKSAEQKKINLALRRALLRYNQDQKTLFGINSNYRP